MPEYPQGFFSEMVNAIADAVYVKDAQHKWIFLNTPARELLQLSPSDFEDKNEFDFFPRKTAWAIYNNDQEVFKTEAPAGTELQITINGQEYYFAFHSSLFRIDKTEKYVVCTVRDITQRRNAEIRLYEEKERLRLLSDYAGIGVITCSTNAEINYMNQRAMDYSGVTPDAMHEVSLEEIILPSERFMALMEKQKRKTDSKVVDAFEGTIKHVSGILLPVHIQLTPIFNDGQFIEMLIILKEENNDR